MRLTCQLKSRARKQRLRQKRCQTKPAAQKLIPDYGSISDDLKAEATTSGAHKASPIFEIFPSNPNVPSNVFNPANGAQRRRNKAEYLLTRMSAYD